MEDSVWTTASGGIDFTLPMVVLTANGAIPCCFVDPEVGNAADVDTSSSTVMDTSSSYELPKQLCVPPSLCVRPQGRCPLAKAMDKPEVSDSTLTSSAETDPDKHIESHKPDVAGGLRDRPTGKPSPQLCPVCWVGTTSKVNLVHHLRTVYPSTRLFPCSKCEIHFNNATDLTSHMSNSHSVKKFVCRHCGYSVVNRSRMHLHMRHHTGGIRYTRCDKGFPMKRALQKHSDLHGQQEVFTYEQCDQVYATENSLKVHVKGKHGGGFCCLQCQKCFDSPVQLQCHKKHGPCT